MSQANQTEKNKFLQKYFSKKRSFVNIIILAVLTILITLLLMPTKRISRRHYLENQIADRDIRASRNFENIIDEEASLRKKQEALSELLQVYDFEPKLYQVLLNKLDKTFFQARTMIYQASQKRKEGSFDEAEAIEQEIKNTVNSLLGTELSDKTYKVLRRGHFGGLTQKAIKNLINRVPASYLVAAKKTLQGDAKGKIVLRTITNAKVSEEKLLEKSSLTDLEELNLWLDQQTLDKSGLSSRARQAVITLAKNIIKPNVTLNLEETEKRRKQTIDSVKNVTIPIKKGEIIVRRGDRIKKHHLTIIRGMQQAENYSNDIEIIMGKGLLIFILLLSFHIFGAVFLRKYRPQEKDVYFLACCLLFAVASAQIFQALVQLLHQNDSWIELSAAKYLFPGALVVMVVRLALNQPTTALFSVILATMMGLTFDGSFSYTIYTLIGSLAGASYMGNIDRRSALIKAGIKVSLVNAGLCLTIMLAQGKLLAPFVATAISGDYNPLWSVAFALLSGPIIAFFLLPASSLIEVFGYLTNIKLIELSNLNNPLLSKLALIAPGTYHHSRVISHLAEAAAEAIGANPLLATVMAYYHDIGKIKQPHYFTENQERGEDRHSKLRPSMSKMIITSHVTSGVEMAREAKLPKEIIAAIPEHHGTSLISYFYTKAKEQEDPEVDEITEREFRYLGPKPQSRETAILMLADTVEATSKSLVDPTPAQLQGIVQKTINKLFADGQFDECELTLKDLHKIAKTFLKILASIYKPRIDYPTPPGKDKKKKDADINSKQTKTEKSKPAEGQADSQSDLKRLGLGKD